MSREEDATMPAPEIRTPAMLYAHAIALEATLSFLGVGILPPEPSFGAMLSDSVKYFTVIPSYLFIPGTVLALLVIVIAVLFAVTAFRSVRRTSRWLWRGALWIGILTFAQGPLGGSTVLGGLHPIAVLSHFLLAIVVLLIAVVLVLEEFGLAGAWPERPGGWVPWAGVGIALWAWATIISGGVATMSGTHPGSDDRARKANEYAGKER